MGIWDCKLGCTEKKQRKKKQHLVAVRKNRGTKSALGCSEKQ